ncbi:MAG: hypothetical protein DWQ02_25440 [Bacteroidetes bacterium]|nr:MAG: hypothetical protein DWQ02_25440 [Bacteroidota bacterium]
MKILTVILGVVFVLLVLSLLATTIMELIAAFMHLRGKNLKKALGNMLVGLKDDGTTEDESFLEKFKNNALFRQLSHKYSNKTTNPPSYLSAKSFQSILFDIILGDEKISEQDVIKEINNIENADLRNVLNQLVRDADGKLEGFKENVETWYDSVMDRATGWYKRQAKKILIYVGLVMAIILNADTLAIYERLESDPETLAQVVAMAEEMAAKPDSASIVKQNMSFEEASTELNALLENNLNTIKSPLGLGWKNVDFEKITVYDWLTKALGWIITALAISLGAPFWFDILKKIVSIRSSGGTTTEKK